MTVSGVLETALYVDHLDRSAAFYKRVFGFEPMYEEGERMKALNVANRQVLLLFAKGKSVAPTVTPRGVIPPHDGAGNLHLAFAIPRDELTGWEQRLYNLGIPIESRVTWDGGASLYFRDPDGHAIELATPGIWPIY